MLRGGLILALGGLSLVGCPTTTKDLALPVPTGAHSVGTQTYALADATRREGATLNPDDVRELVVQLWYPSDEPVVSPVLYAVGAFGDLASFLYKFAADFENFVTTDAQVGLPLSASRERYPVILFSHALGASRELYTSTMQDLASNGYIVAAINHTYGAAVTVFPDGTQRLFRALPPFYLGEEEDEYLQDTSKLGSVEFYDDLSETWSDDIRFVLDSLESWNDDPSNVLFGRMDLERVGACGHSLGGAAAALTALRDPRFLAAANLDGTLRSDVRTAPIAMPLLLINSPTHFDPGTTLRSAWDRLQSGGVEVEFAGAGHLSYSDLGVLTNAFTLPQNRRQDIYTFGTGDALAMLETSDAYVLAFFDRYLRGIDSPLLDGSSEPEDGVTVNLKSFGVERQGLR